MAGRLIAVGDVHGCIEELEELLAAVSLAPTDTLAFVGDLVAKGPDSHAVVARARALGALAVRGNHDEHCLRWWRAVRDGREPPRLRPAHRAACDALSEEDFAWLDALPLFLHLPEHGVLVVHGGIPPGAAPETVDPDLLMNMRSIDAAGRPSKRIEDGVPWASLWAGPERAVFGHDAVRGLQRHPHAIGLDSGCVYGGALSALVLPDDRVVSVRARRTWAPVEGNGS